MSSDSSILGPEVLVNDDEGTLVHGAAHGHGPGGGGGGGGGGGTGSPASTLVGTAGGFQIDLIWDSSVMTNSNWSAIEKAIADAASYTASLFKTPEVVNIHIGWGEIAGSAMSPNALGESESYGYLTNYATATSLLHGYTAAINAPTGAQFFITSAQAKENPAFGVSQSANDGYIGFGTLNNTGWNTISSGPTSGAGTGTNSGYDLQSVAQHEISEIMGRIEMEGQSMNGQATYTTLDLFNYNHLGYLELSGGGGYFSNDGGVTHWGTFNNSSAYGGDIADWASATSPYSSNTYYNSTTLLGTSYQDSYDAFGYSGINGDLSYSDVLVDHSLGYV